MCKVKKKSNTKHQTLIYHAKLLKHELKATSTRLTYQKKTLERKRINKQLTNNSRNVYRSFRGNSTDMKETPAQEDVEKYWNNIWGKQGNFNNDAPWIRTLENEYCANTQLCENSEITINGVNDPISKLQDNKSPGNDLIVGYWYKHFMFYRNDLAALFNRTLNSVIEIPNWLAKAKTKLLPKNSGRKQPNNYRPIALQNIMLKLYTSCMNQLLQHHCDINNIVTIEQAGGKKDMWGCLEQLLVNKTILEEVTKNHRSLVTLWLNYQKALDSVPHKWLIKALKLAKVPEKIINVLVNLMKKWSTRVNIESESVNIESKIICYLRGIFQMTIFL